MTPLVAHAAPEPAFTPATLVISSTDGQSREVEVRSARQLRNAIQPCFRKIQCEEISVETCDRCFMTAEAVYGGYLVQSRLGPPGPLYDLIDDRPGRQNTATFSLSDLTTLFVDYLTDRKTIPLAWRDTGQI
ncbi:hypothetical protein [Sphingopyxis macrogoltabida]|uniref:Uncharacterized protein n=2 Tax=Sphingopyxis macrogoltabida TaxID=33050 RepID=A0AAC9FFI8_SPHMC|nr:hypothetical protein [Sphingopyxis macrogoltabida]ALJ12937.1 hypothetical protein LH19_08640 [Sphingopyxis macrogoltabida]AMU89596.1 hypothetical protein ATM17_11200 [Sphingopyxis macrogoltabida]